MGEEESGVVFESALKLTLCVDASFLAIPRHLGRIRPYARPGLGRGVRVAGAFCGAMY